MNEKLKEKILESLASVTPITLIVLILSVVIVPMDIGTITMFLAGAALLVIGMGFFQLGAEMSMTPMGEGLGVTLSKSRRVWIVALVSFVMGVIITIAEPDLQVLATQVPSIPNFTLIITVAVGVGIFLVMAILRILFKFNLSHMLIIFYGLVFIVSIFTPGDFLSVAFDSGGVTTGPITVPFIMAMGVGLASTRSDKDAAGDSFGLVALSSIGPILAVMLLGIFYDTGNSSYEATLIPTISTTRDLAYEFMYAIPHYAKEVAYAILPILGVFFIFQLATKRFQKRQTMRMLVGFLYTYIGLVLFLCGVNVGFIGVGHLLGSGLASTAYKWIMVPLGMVIGYYIVSAEPAVHVLNKQVEEVSEGAIPSSAMSKALSLGVAFSVGISMIRILTGISIYWILVPGYIIAIGLTFFSPKIFVGIAFDSGGVASGPMTSTFLLPLAIGACEAVGGNVMTDAFGVVAMVAMTPLIAIQIMGIISERRNKRVMDADLQTDAWFESEEIIEYGEVTDSDE